MPGKGSKSSSPPRRCDEHFCDRAVRGDRCRRRARIEHDAELAGGEIARVTLAVSPDFDRKRFVALGDDLQILLLVKRLAVVGQQDIARLQAVRRGVGAWC